jgi:hypothetical protein
MSEGGFYEAQDLLSSERVPKPRRHPLPPVDPVELEAEYLLGASFPASKDDVIGVARQNAAPERILHALAELPDRQYADVADLLTEVELLNARLRSQA